MAALVLKETGLLPHINPGVMSVDEIRRAARGLGVARDHAGNRLRAPVAQRRAAFRLARQDALGSAATIAAAGEAAVPFTSGILIGIGETRRERIEALLALRDLHGVTVISRKSSSRISAPSPARAWRNAPEPDARGSSVDHRGGANSVRAGDEHPGAAESQPAVR